MIDMNACHRLLRSKINLIKTQFAAYITIFDATKYKSK